VRHDGIRIGDIEVSVICEGYAPIDLVEEFPDTELDWEAERSRYPWAFHDETSWAWHVHAFALRTPQGLVLIDTGLGSFPPYRPWASSVPRLDALAAAGVDRNDVVAVAHTHLHADHAGGAVVDGEPVFPNARHHVHPEDWAFFASAEASDDTNRVPMTVLEQRDQLELRADDHRVVEGVKAIWAPGHTPGHRAVLVTSGEETALFTGDALHTPPQVRLPAAPSNHDEDPQGACASRARAMHDAREHGWLVAVSHFAEPFGRVVEDGWRSEA
jgi:glyoxylase-like metal-dependent hydrolase (beta-lactamase superfamily II)